MKALCAIRASTGKHSSPIIRGKKAVERHQRPLVRPIPGQVGKFSFKSSLTPGKQPPQGSALSRKTLLIGGQVTPDHSFVATLVCSSVSQEFTSVPF
jgi:hypothetical protein